LGWVVDIDELAPVLRDSLDKLRRGKDIGVRDQEGEPVLSLQSFARVMGNPKAYSYLSKFARANVMPVHHGDEPGRKYNGNSIHYYEF